MSAGRRRGRHDNRRQYLVEAVAPHLEPGRQAEGGAKLFGRLVHGEAGTVGRDLEQHPAGLPVVDRLEVPALDHRRHVPPCPQQEIPPGDLRRRVRRPPGDVVHGAQRSFAAWPTSSSWMPSASRKVSASVPNLLTFWWSTPSSRKRLAQKSSEPPGTWKDTVVT